MAQKQTMLRALTNLVIVLRATLALLGIGSIVLGASALSKLGHPWVDSPRWMFAVFGGLAIGVGLGLIWYAVRGLGSRPPHSRT